VSMQITSITTTSKENITGHPIGSRFVTIELEVEKTQYAENQEDVDLFVYEHLMDIVQHNFSPRIQNGHLEDKIEEDENNEEQVGEDEEEDLVLDTVNAIWQPNPPKASRTYTYRDILGSNCPLHNESRILRANYSSNPPSVWQAHARRIGGDFCHESVHSYENLFDIVAKNIV
jgi:hypothetical protein